MKKQIAIAIVAASLALMGGVAAAVQGPMASPRPADVPRSTHANATASHADDGSDSSTASGSTESSESTDASDASDDAATASSDGSTSSSSDSSSSEHPDNHGAAVSDAAHNCEAT